MDNYLLRTDPILRMLNTHLQGGEFPVWKIPGNVHPLTMKNPEEWRLYLVQNILESEERIHLDMAVAEKVHSPLAKWNDSINHERSTAKARQLADLAEHAILLGNDGEALGADEERSARFEMEMKARGLTPFDNEDYKAANDIETTIRDMIIVAVVTGIPKEECMTKHLPLADLAKAYERLEIGNKSTDPHRKRKQLVEDFAGEAYDAAVAALQELQPPQTFQQIIESGAPLGKSEIRKR